MSERDKLEKKLFLHTQASGTKNSLDLLEKLGLQVLQKLKDILTANEVKFKKEVKNVKVDEIIEHDLVLSRLWLELVFGFDHFGLNLGTMDLVTATSLRSPNPKDRNPPAAQGSSIADQSKVTIFDNRENTSGKSSRPSPDIQTREVVFKGHEALIVRLKGLEPDTQTQNTTALDQRPNDSTDPILQNRSS